MTVTVAVPYYGVPDLIGRAVSSILAQTHADLRLLVIGDGQSPPIHASDSRLELYVLPENRGTYFALQLALLASPDSWHAPHGADDWTDPTHLETLMALNRDAVALGTAWVHSPEPKLTSIGREGWHVGVYSSERLMAIGGYDPSARLSQDTLVLHLLDATGGYLRHKSADPTYHVWRHPGSLTTSKTTGMQSLARGKARGRNMQIEAKCRRLRTLPKIRTFRERLVPQRIHDELQEHVSRLRARL
jgi:glycosyltransferase involved in cell wall biosynthesis